MRGYRFDPEKLAASTIMYPSCRAICSFHIRECAPLNREKSLTVAGLQGSSNKGKLKVRISIIESLIILAREGFAHSRTVFTQSATCGPIRLGRVVLMMMPMLLGTVDVAVVSAGM